MQIGGRHIAAAGKVPEEGTPPDSVMAIRQSRYSRY
jgi:hypothetical protein